MPLAVAEGFRLTPRFRMQGSFAYHTVNHPAWLPPQEVDVDDGTYLPTSFVARTTPVVAAAAFFATTEGILAPLCEREGWEMDRGKPSCIRLKITPKAHLDVPLYAIPDDEFDDPEVVAKADGAALSEAVRAEISDEAYRELPKGRIMLVRRNGTWEESDPRKLHDWFQDAVNELGDHLRRVCRHLKAWRDHQRPEGGMSSICLMVCVVAVFREQAGRLAEGRDDVALREVAGRLPVLLGAGIENPVVGGKRLDDQWSDEARADYVGRARALSAAIGAAMDGASPDAAIVRLKGVLGERVPDDASLIRAETHARAILGRPAAKVAAPVVPRTTSG